jgi:S-DNA-T family DNA segregation ATPase FtsK/SpoIIIE
MAKTTGKSTGKGSGKSRAPKKKQPTSRHVDWRALPGDPVFQSILATLVSGIGLITLLGLFGVTSGRVVDAWVGYLRYWFGWGVYPVSVTILLAGLLWFRHQMDRPVQWRWRPLVGVELVLFGLLALTHTIAGQGDLGRMWRLVEDGWAGGLVGWAVTVMFAEYLGWPVGAAILLGVLVLGLGLAFDVTGAQVRQAARALWGVLGGGRARRRAAGSADAARDRLLGTSRVRPAEARPGPARPEAGRVAGEERARVVRPAPVVRNTRAQTGHARPVPREATSTGRSRPAEGLPSHAASPADSRGGQAPVLPPLPRVFTLPTVDMLNEPEGPVLTDDEIRAKSAVIEETLAQFGLPVEVAEVRVGPTVTQFGVRPGFVERAGAGGKRRRHKVRVSQISTLADDLALALAAPRLRIEAPVPGRSIVGIEVPNSRVQLVGLREVMTTEGFDELASPLAIALGRDVAGEPVVADLARMPHLLIAGTTGSGKSVCIKAITTCLIFNNSPNDLRLVMIDPKMVELVRFNGLPHLYGRVEVDLERVVKVLRWVALEMDERYRKFSEITARNLADYNRAMEKKGVPALPHIVVLVDELADLMMLAPDEVERTICRIAQMARATGIHLVVATQRPSVDVVTGLIKANFPARISFATVSQTDSRVILDTPGAETLMGSGDMLFLAADAGYPVRVQGCFVSEGEVERVVESWHRQGGPPEAEAPWERMMRPGEQVQGEGNGDDDLLGRAIDLVRSSGSASASLLQRKLRIGHPRAARLMRQMEEMGVVGPAEAAGRTRRVIIGGSD